MSTTITEHVTLIVETCCRCGIHFAAPTHFFNTRREDKESFYCPNGHGQSYRKSTADELRTQLAAKEREVTIACRQRDENWQAVKDRDKSITALRGQVTKAKKRVGNGVCPCCNRHFTALQRHMHTMHPEYKDGATVA